MHSDLQTILNELDKSDAEARRLVEDLDEAQLNWQPNGGRAWSVAQCLDHLARANAVYTDALQTAVRGVRPGSAPRRGPIQPGRITLYFIGLLDPPPRRRLKAPRKAIPALHTTREQVLADFLAAHQRTRALIAACPNLNLNRIRFNNPFVGFLRFTVGAGLLIIAAHDRRHLWQAQHVRALIESKVFEARR